MKVYLVRTECFNIEDFENVYNLLNAYPGAIEFKNGGTLDLDDPLKSKTFNNKTKFLHQEQVFYSHSVSSADSCDYEPPTFPFTKKVYSWRQLFFAVDHYKREKQIENQMENNDFVFLLTNQ